MSIARVLAAIAAASRAFDEHARTHEALGVTTRASSGLAVRPYVDGTTVELYAEAELAGGTLVCWWLELRDIGQEMWRVTGELLVDGGTGQRVAGSVTERTATSPDEIVSHISEAVPALLKMRCPELEG